MTYQATLQVNNAIVFSDSTMQPHFRDYMLRVNTAIVTVESGVAAAGGTAAWGGITGTLSDQTDLQSAIDATQAASNITSGTFDDARIAESSVTQHEAALSIGVSQITGLDLWTYVRLASDFSISTTANNNVTGLAFTPAASKNYHIEGFFLLETSVTSTGARPGIAWPTGYANGAAMMTAPNSATAFATQFNVAGTTANAASTGLPIITKSYLGRMEGILVMGGSPSGDLQITLASEIAASSVTMKAGSFIRYREYS